MGLSLGFGSLVGYEVIRSGPLEEKEAEAAVTAQRRTSEREKTR